MSYNLLTRQTMICAYQNVHVYANNYWLSGILIVHVHRKYRDDIKCWNQHLQFGGEFVQCAKKFKRRTIIECRYMDRKSTKPHWESYYTWFVHSTVVFIVSHLIDKITLRSPLWLRLWLALFTGVRIPNCFQDRQFCTHAQHDGTAHNVWLKTVMSADSVFLASIHVWMILNTNSHTQEQ